MGKYSLLGFILILGVEVQAKVTVGFGPLSESQAQARLEHSQELLGKYYQKSTVRQGESVRKINSQIYRWTRERLPASDKEKTPKIAQTVIDQAHHYGLDPVFLMSIIQTESTFNPRARGTSGEIGLMQILPATAEWIAKKSGIPWKGANSLLDPLVNIRIGAAYIAFLRDRFDMHARLYIAAYNMGQGNVDHAQARNIWPKDYPGAVMRNYVDFYASLSSETKTTEAKTATKTAVARVPAAKKRDLSFAKSRSSVMATSLDLSD